MTLERQFREAFPTLPSRGDWSEPWVNRARRACATGVTLGQIIERHPEFDLLRTPIDEFLTKSIRPEFRAMAKDETFRLELKAVQRVFKLAPTFEGTEGILADGIHSAQMIYRLGESEFVRRYGKRPGFTVEAPA